MGVTACEQLLLLSNYAAQVEEGCLELFEVWWRWWNHPWLLMALQSTTRSALRGVGDQAMLHFKQGARMISRDDLATVDGVLWAAEGEK